MFLEAARCVFFVLCVKPRESKTNGSTSSQYCLLESCFAFILSGLKDEPLIERGTYVVRSLLVPGSASEGTEIRRLPLLFHAHKELSAGMRLKQPFALTWLSPTPAMTISEVPTDESQGSIEA